MDISTFFRPKYKIAIHLIAIAATIMSIVVTLEGCERTEEASPLCINLIATLVFNMAIYFLAFILFPLLVKNWKKYVILAVVFLIVYSFTLGWLRALSLSGVTYFKDIFSSIPLKYLDFDYTFRSFMTIIPMGVLSWLYFMFVMDWEKLKASFFKENIERTVNITVVILIITYTSIMPQGDSSEEVLYITAFIIFFYINTFFITPILIKDKKKQKFLAASLLWFLMLYSMFFLILYLASNSLGKEFVDRTFLSPSHAFRMIVILLAPIFLISFIYGYIRIKIKNQDIKLGAKDSELQLLKSQVNPHFLFNTLNTLYATALEEKADRTAESTAKLASLIRYMQEDINKAFIPLEHEIGYLKDYIAIQKLRCAVEPQIDTQFTNIENHEISPGLLIPFVENAFKYGIDPSAPSSLKVSVICNENTINFECVNSYNDAFKTYYKEQGFGIGIKNARQRLGLVYPKKHTFELVKESNVFSVKISIKTK
ncbi:sensor histidine kinase [Snuella sedimenti]|uniref:Histidine kinase n=1 Tax=Snuella sedimenti TaxID=2798802 RepID=A0A8J7LXX5_9FLAO|nr:histidine kinase [Snuella sedimenti]MBJ6367541.1 histidine kinase [Snuella sedimenti]